MTPHMKRGDEIKKIEKIRKLKKKVAFLRNWSFVLGEEPSSYIGNSVILSSTSDRSLTGYGSPFDSGEFYINFCCHPNAGLLYFGLVIR